MSMKLFIALIALALVGCSPANRVEPESQAKKIWAQHGFEVIAYEGYQWGIHIWPGYGGAYVWYRLRKIPDNGVTYSGSLQQWGDEIHVYGPTAHDAIRPR